MAVGDRVRKSEIQGEELYIETTTDDGRKAWVKAVGVVSMAAPLYDPANLTPLSGTAGAAVSEIAPANPDRKEAWLQNTSKTGYVWFCDDDPASVGGAGCSLIAPLGTYFTTSTGPLTMIKDTGSVDCLVTGQEAI